MTAVLCVTVFFAVVACAIANQTATYRCSYNENGLKQFQLKIIEDDDKKPKIQQLVGKGQHNEDCAYDYRSGDILRVNAEATDTATLVHHCGIQIVDKREPDQAYVLILTTSSCTHCLVSSDREYKIMCPFDTLDTDQYEMIIADAIGVEDDFCVAAKVQNCQTLVCRISAGTADQMKENVELKAHLETEPEVLLSKPITLRDRVYLNATLKLKGFATGLIITECFATNTEESKTVDLIKNGCTSPGLGIMEDDKGFEVDSASLTKFNTVSPVFSAFIFINKDNVILINCTAKFCYDKNAKSCQKSCKSGMAPAIKLRRLRAVKTEREQSLIFLMKVTTDNTTTVSINTDKNMSPSECSHRTYIIGLVIVGCVLILTFVVSLALFFALRRNRDVSSKITGFDNKCMT